MTGMGLLENPLESCLQFNNGQWASAEFVTSGSGHGVDLLQRYSGPFKFVLPNAVFIGSEILPKWMNKPGRIRAWKEKFLWKMAHWNRLWTVQWAPLKGQQSP